ncbi:MAG: alpha/beta hydrolase-fold protein [Bacteroidota bacterium]
MAVTPPAQTEPFDVFLTHAEQAALSVRQALADTFWDRLERTPLVEGDAVVFLYRGEARTVRLLGDTNSWNRPDPLRRIEGTDLWFRREPAEPEARLEYLFLVDSEAEGFGAETAGTPDPTNPHRVLSAFGPFSEVAMPGYAYPEVFAPVRDGTPGSAAGLDRHVLPAGALPYAHEALVYTPPGYARDEAARYPTVIFLDGQDYVAFAHAPAVLDWLANRGEAVPVVAVFLDPPNRHSYTAPNRATEYALNDDFVAFLAGELVPFVDARYRTQAAPEARLVVGDSYAGLAAVYAPLRRPDVFGGGYSQSGYHSYQNNRLVRILREAEAPPIRLCLDVGTYERSVGAGLLPDDETDFTAANRRLQAALAARGYDAEYAEYPEGHTWGTWRAHLLDALPHFFPSHKR